MKSSLLVLKQPCMEYLTIVCVFPDPVWPYANIQTLYPSRTDRIRGCVSENTSSAREKDDLAC